MSLTDNQHADKLSLRLLLAEDDLDDCLLFKEALEELPVSAHLNTVNDGEQLMKRLLEQNKELPSILFLDLNMPRKNGHECLAEIQANGQLQHIPVVIISTSFNPEVVLELHTRGAFHYVRKPGRFSDLKSVLFNTLTSAGNPSPVKPTFENFVVLP